MSPTLELDSTGSIVFSYTLSGDYTTDYSVNDFLDYTDFSLDERNSDNTKKVYVLARTSDRVRFVRSLQDIVALFQRENGLPELELSSDVYEILEEGNTESKLYSIAKKIGAEIKNSTDFQFSLGSSFKRSLKPFQKQSVAHILATNNAANFSVPGSGKTTTSYAAISKWLEDGVVEKIFVIGPLASFVAWEQEFKECFGKKPKSLRIARDNFKILEDLGEIYDLFLVSYQSASNNYDAIQRMLAKYKTVLILDESHRIKNPNAGKWVESMKILAPYATRRLILTGTPMPNDYRDLWTQITFLWPQVSPLGTQAFYNQSVMQSGLSSSQRDILFPLYTRVMKDDLKLPPVNFKRHDVKLKPRQREIYDVIEAKTLEEINQLEERSKLQKFRVAKMIRLLQTASNPSLLDEHSLDFDVRGKHFDSFERIHSEDDDVDTPRQLLSSQFGFDVGGVDDDDLDISDVSDKISRYSELEIPAKISYASNLAKKLVEDGEKVVIWSTFLDNMSIFQNKTLDQFDPIIINGTVSKDPTVENNRDFLIHEFLNNPDRKILIGTAASIGESVSLHKDDDGHSACKHAIYLDRNFNGAQYMQSVDRLHRVGMPENVTVTYHLLVGTNTIDERIDARLFEKWQNMTDALNDPFLERINLDTVKQTEDEFNADYLSLVDYMKSKQQNDD